MKKTTDQMTKKPVAGAAEEMPGAAAITRAKNSTSNNAAAKRGKVKGTPKGNKRRAARY